MASRHRPVSPRARSSVASRLLMPVMIAGLLFVGLAIYTVVNGELRLPFGGGVLFAFQKDEPKQDGLKMPEGSVAVFACPRELPAYTKITREHLDVGTKLYTLPATVAQVKANGLFRADDEGYRRILGRVLRRNKPVNYVFTESDFLPKGTRPGLNAGIPPGKRGMWIDTSDVHGLADARAGDRIDLMAAAPVKAQQSLDTNVLGNLTDPVMKARLDSLTSRNTGSNKARSWVVARGAKVLTEARSRAEDTQRTKGKAKKDEQVFVAMTPDEVALFGQALAQKVTILAAPRSAQPDASNAEIRDSQPTDVNDDLRRMLNGGDDSEPSFGMVEVIRGGERQTVTVPRSKEKGKR